MSAGGGRVLIVEDDRAMCEWLDASLTKRGYRVQFHTDAAAALEALPAVEPGVVLTDLNLRGQSGIELCAQLAKERPDLPVIVLTAFGTFDSAVAAIRAGAYDFLTKPVELDALALAVDRALQHRALKEEVKRLRQAVAEARGFGELLGQSAPMRKVYDLLERVSDSDASVLITGESGTGKEVIARTLHQRGRRRDGPFVAINCAAMPEALLESELFGHAKGAFTDARASRPGLFVKASGGTIFLDELGELPLGLQPKLLRALQEKTVRPVGSDSEVPFDARVVAATNRDLEALVEERKFREDLFFRINVIHLALPPLRVRGNDILLLAQHHVALVAEKTGKKVVGLSPAAAEKLLAYDWPGNVRELQNCIERAVVLTRFEQLAVEDLPDKIRAHKSATSAEPVSDEPADLVPLDEIERRYILRVLSAVKGNKRLAASVLGLDRKTLYRKLERYGHGVERDEKPESSAG